MTLGLSAATSVVIFNWLAFFSDLTILLLLVGVDSFVISLQVCITACAQLVLPS